MCRSTSFGGFNVKPRRYEQAANACDSLETARDGLSDLKDSIDEIISSLEDAAQ